MTYRIIRLLIVLFVMTAMAFALFGCPKAANGQQIKAVNLEEVIDPCYLDLVLDAIEGCEQNDMDETIDPCYLDLLIDAIIERIHHRQVMETVVFPCEPNDLTYPYGEIDYTQRKPSITDKCIIIIGLVIISLFVCYLWRYPHG